MSIFSSSVIWPSRDSMRCSTSAEVDEGDALNCDVFDCAIAGMAIWIRSDRTATVEQSFLMIYPLCWFPILGTLATDTFRHSCAERASRQSELSSKYELRNHLQNARVTYTVDRAKAVLVGRYEIAICVERQIGRSEIGQTRDIQGCINTAELCVVQGIECVNAQLKSSLLAEGE